MNKCARFKNVEVGVDWEEGNVELPGSRYTYDFLWREKG